MRVHLALLEIARGQRLTGNPAPEQHLAAVHADELLILDNWLCRRQGRAASPEGLHTLAALVTGLRLGLVTPGSSLTFDEACGILRRVTASEVCTPDPHRDG